MNAVARTRHRINWTTIRRPDGRMVGDLGGNSTDSRRPPGGLLKHRATDWLSTTRPTNNKSETSALPLRNSQSASYIGRDTRGLTRPAFTEALTGKIGVSWIRAAKPEVNRLFDEAFKDMLAD